MQVTHQGSRMEFSLDELRKIIDPVREEGEFRGRISGVATLLEAREGDLTFLGNPKYKNNLSRTAASVLLVPQSLEREPGPGQTYFFVENPSLSLARLCSLIEHRTWPKPAPGIHPTAVIDRDAVIAESATIGPLCSIGPEAIIGDEVVLTSHVHIGQHARVGDGTWVMPNATIGDFCRVGCRGRIHSGVVVGADGFGYETVGGQHQKVPQIGVVVIGDDVEIGANTTIDRARFSETIIGDGTKVDNLVQIGHNVRIGKHCLIVSQVGISGSVTIEDYVVIGGQSGVVGHVRIGKGSQIAAQSGISKDVPPGSMMRGSPALDFPLASRIMAVQRRLPEFFKRLKQLEHQMKQRAQSIGKDS